MRARQFVLRTHYSMYRRCPQRWRIAMVATDTPPNLLPVQGLYYTVSKDISAQNQLRAHLIKARVTIHYMYQEKLLTFQAVKGLTKFLQAHSRHNHKLFL